MLEGGKCQVKTGGVGKHYHTRTPGVCDPLFIHRNGEVAFSKLLYYHHRGRNSLRYMGDSMNRLLETQRYVNQTMAAHMNTSMAAQETQSVALAQLIEST